MPPARPSCPASSTRTRTPPMVLYRGLADDLALMDWLQKYIFPAEAKTVTPEFVRAGTRLAALEMIESGTTTYADMYYFEEEIAPRDEGGGPARRPRPDDHPLSGRGREDAGGRASRAPRAFLDRFAGDDLIVPALAPHAMYTLDTATLKAVRALADRKHAPVLIHLAETSDEVKNSIRRARRVACAVPRHRSASGVRAPLPPTASG